MVAIEKTNGLLKVNLNSKLFMFLAFRSKEMESTSDAVHCEISDIS